jgi:chitinase
MKLLTLLALLTPVLEAQASLPTFQYTAGSGSYTLVGHPPAQSGTTTIPTMLVSVTLSFDAKQSAGRPLVMDAAPDAAAILASPIFSNFAFPAGGTTQYADAMLRATFPHASDWHTLLAKPELKNIRITVPVGYGYILSSKSSGRSFAIADLEFVQKEIFKQLPRQAGKLIIAHTRNTAFYALGDATVCCSWGTHGVDSATGNSFVLGSYLQQPPSIVEDKDIQPLTQQFAQFIKDPHYDPLIQGRNVKNPGNSFPSWLRPATMRPGDQGVCGGAGAGTMYFLLEPNNTNPKNNLPASPAFAVKLGSATYHLQNTALLPWYIGAAEGLGSTYSFPDAQALPERAKPCPPRGPRAAAAAAPTAAPIPANGPPNGHALIGYYAGYGGPGSNSSLREISSQWDYVLIAFATPDHNAPEGTMQFRTPAGLDTQAFKADIAYLQSKGKKVMLSLGGGGQHFTLADPQRVPTFVSSLTRIITDYGFDGIDIDFESPSLSIAPGDTDFRRPTTPSIVNLIAALRQLQAHFGPKFLISLVPEGTQIPSGYPSYGGQFGSYLPITHALRDSLVFMDVQSYNTPPLQGLDGEIYQPGTVDYHVAMTELLLQGFPVGGNPAHFFPPMPAHKVAVGFLNGDTTPAIVSQAMDYLITGKAPAGTKYKLRQPKGYPGLLGAMFWTINADRRENYRYSNLIGPQLHALPKP